MIMNRKNKDAPIHPIVRTALLIAGLTTPRVRAREVLFYVDMVKNIFEASIHCPDFELQTVQILRIFRRFHEQNWGHMASEGAAVSLTLHGRGLFHILRTLLDVDYIMPLNESIFLQWFLDSYQDHIRVRLKSALNHEDQQQLENHLQPYALFKAQMKRLELGMTDMQRRVDDSRRLLSFVDKARAHGLEPEEIVQTLPSEFSYRLSHQKRLRTWLLELPDDVMPFEIEQGIAKRQKHLYRRLLDSMQITRSFYEDAIQASDAELGTPLAQKTQHFSSLVRV